MTEEEFKIREKFWDRKKFRTFTVREIESRSRQIQKAMVAIKDMDRKEAIKFLRKEYPSEADYILSIIPVTFKCHA